MIRSRLRVAGLLALALPLVATSVARAQNDFSASTRDDAVLVLDGVVREVFTSTRQSGTDQLVQIEVTRAEPGPGAVARRLRLLIPAAGESVYVRVGRSAPGARGNPPAEPPVERSQVRAYLYPAPFGGWQSALGSWFDRTSDRPAPANPFDPDPTVAATPPPARTPAEMPAPAPAPTAAGSALPAFGIKAQYLQASGRTVLRVVEVAPGSPAQQGGLEPGDVIVAVNGQPLAGPQTFEAALRAGKPALEILVLNVRNGESTPVEISLAGMKLPAEAPAPVPTTRTEPASTPRPTPPTTVPTRTIGIATEAVRVGLRPALKVTEVQPGSPAQKAGLEVGDVIAEANDVPTVSPDQLAAVIQESGPILNLNVLDVRTGKKVPVEVELGGAPAPSTPAQPAPAPRSQPQPRNTPAPTTPAPAGSSVQALGIATEETTVNLVPALKVTRVAPGSPAQRAGLEVGDVIFSANEIVTFTPEQLEGVLKESGPKLKLTVQPARSRQRTTVEVNLSGR